MRKLLRGFLYLVFKIELRGQENLPKNGGILIAANHRSNWDAVILGAFTKRKLNFMAKAELFRNKLAGWFFYKIGAFPVERGKGDIGAVKTALKILSAGEALLIFPEGTRTSDEKSGKAKTGAVMIASRAEVPVLPVYISGEYKWRNKITVNFGESIIVANGDGEKLSKEQLQNAADNVMDTIRKLKV